MGNKKFGKALLILLLVSAVGAVIWAAFLQDIVSMTKRSFGSYKDFIEKAETPYFARTLPNSASNLECYWHSAWFVKTAGYRVSLSDQDYTDWKQAASERYTSYVTAAVTESFQQDEAQPAQAADFAQLDRDGVGFVSELCGSEQAAWSVFKFVKIDNSNSEYHFGILCNESTHEVIEFFSRNTNPKAL